MKTKKFDEMEEEERAKAAFSTLYEGYVVDLIKALSKQVKFKYEMYIVADGNYGALNEQTGKWNGMIADLINHVSSILVTEKDSNRLKIFQGKSLNTSFMNFDINSRKQICHV